MKIVNNLYNYNYIILERLIIVTSSLLDIRIDKCYTNSAGPDYYSDIVSNELYLIWIVTVRL